METRRLLSVFFDYMCSVFQSITVITIHNRKTVKVSNHESGTGSGVSLSTRLKFNEI